MIRMPPDRHIIFQPLIVQRRAAVCMNVESNALSPVTNLRPWVRSDDWYGALACAAGVVNGLYLRRTEGAVIKADLVHQTHEASGNPFRWPHPNIQVSNGPRGEYPQGRLCPL